MGDGLAIGGGVGGVGGGGGREGGSGGCGEGGGGGGGFGAYAYDDTVYTTSWGSSRGGYSSEGSACEGVEGAHSGGAKS